MQPFLVAAALIALCALPSFTASLPLVKLGEEKLLPPNMTKYFVAYVLQRRSPCSPFA